MSEKGTARAAKALGMSEPRTLRLVQPDERNEERASHGVFRPTDLDGYIGQERAQMRVKMQVRAALNRGQQPGPILLSGPPGLGKTTLAMIIAALINEDKAEEDRVALRLLMGSTVRTERALAMELSKVKEGDVLFFDEIHRMGHLSEEMLGLAMEDKRITIPAMGAKGKARVINLPPFTVVGATTKPAGLTRPLRDRFGLHVHLEYYTESELAEIIRRAAERDGLEIDETACMQIAMVGRDTPRIALSRYGLVKDYAEVVGADRIDESTVGEALDVAEIDALGLDGRDRRYLAAVASNDGRRLGLAALVSLTGLDAREITHDIEPDLVRGKMLDLGQRGRCLTVACYEHLWPGMTIPPLLGLG